ncbi:hypothetical protein E2C01_046327 [Portunus trituberculatus]|uniref:Uncharacterized protein n=1 Tax=Portunus trituberculatus TaxID=210409 RepID=A0A5B7G4K7_PORTR|nr:hypothetical protein [Portunus trituberculatus]
MMKRRKRRRKRRKKKKRKKRGKEGTGEEYSVALLRRQMLKVLTMQWRSEHEVAIRPSPHNSYVRTPPPSCDRSNVP